GKRRPARKREPVIVLGHRGAVYRSRGDAGRRDSIRPHGGLRSGRRPAQASPSSVQHVVHDGGVLAGTLRPGGQPIEPPSSSSRWHPTRPPDTSTACPAPRARDRCLPGDRKSTRLNSSHLVISYAVFCLKKK